ncbi:MAG: ribonuclease R, partial [Phaeodactylibacter sp.]|nr:ribonuclease R [Phaeodactylibacter sp.]
KKRFNPRQILRKIKVDNNVDSIRHALDQLVEQNQLVELEGYKYKLKQHPAAGAPKKTYTGRVDMTRSGSAFIICDGLEEDVFVAAKHLNSALHGDTVEVQTWKPRGRRRFEGEVVSVVQRATEHFLGTIHFSGAFAFVVPDKLNMPVDIFVNLENTKDAKNNDKVVVRVLEWHTGTRKSPEGVITAVLGQSGSSDIEMKGILINAGFNLEFPEEVIAESEKLTDTLTKEEEALRRDMRAITTFTIDPHDAKDFDDALSLEYLENGHYEIGIHIADVTHYVKPGTELDKEAYLRSTSVYLVDRVLPMLPEHLSNGLCSLRPNEDKFTFSAVFEFNKNDKIVNRWFGKTLTHSNHRFTYENAQETLDTGEGPFAAELKVLNMLAKKLRKERFKKGSIDFNMEEVRFRLDENGVPIEVYVKERIDTNMLIEEFMLLANREVAKFIHDKANGLEIPFVYRIHDEPDPDKVIELAAFARELGFDLNVSSPQEIARSYNRLVEAAEQDPGLRLLEPIAIRTMAKAAYSTDNIGHYGLGFQFYSHFTSPIRRYSDVLAHRILHKNLISKTPYRTDKAKLEEQCKHISMQERKAMEAERESVKYKQVEFMEKHVGETFNGRISGMLDKGFFVQLEGVKSEGLVGFDTMNEPFELHSSRLSAKGLRSKLTLRMGDQVQVRIKSTDLARRQIEMEWVTKGWDDGSGIWV